MYHVQYASCIYKKNHLSVCVSGRVLLWHHINNILCIKHYLQPIKKPDTYPQFIDFFSVWLYCKKRT